MRAKFFCWRSPVRAATARAIALQLLPPFITESLVRRRARAPHDKEWEYLPGGWPDGTTDETRGWNHASVSETQQAKWTTFTQLVAGTSPLGISHEAPVLSNDDLIGHNAVMTFGYVLAHVARMRSRLSILDWGGGTGHFYLFAQALLPELKLDYHCSDVPSLCQSGSQRLPQVCFHSDPNDALARTYDLVFASTSLHYSRDWADVLVQLAAASLSHVYLTGVPILENSRSFPVVQRPHKYGYYTEYVGWFFNRDEFLTTARDAGLQLEREFLAVHRPLVDGAPEQAEYRGFLFRKATTIDGLTS